MAPKKRERSKAGRKPDCARCLYEAAQPVKRRRRAVLQSRRAFELTLLGDPLMRLGRALYAVLLLVAFLGKQPDYLVNAARAPAPGHAGREMNALAHAEPVQSQDCLHYCADAHIFARFGPVTPFEGGLRGYISTEILDFPRDEN